jgi:hypothetical protein
MTLEKPNGELQFSFQMLVVRFHESQCQLFSPAGCFGSRKLECGGIVCLLPPHIKCDADCQKRKRNDKRHFILSPVPALDAVPCAFFLEIVVITLRAQQTVAAANA